jgi:hypothetical protein
MNKCTLRDKKRDNSLVLKKLSLGLHSGGALRTYDLSDLYVGVCVADNR